MPLRSALLATALIPACAPVAAQTTAPATAAVTNPVLRQTWDGYRNALDEVHTQMDATPRFIQHTEISLRNPGVANWLDPAGRHQGEIVFRNYVSKTAAVPSARLVKLADLPRVLPKGAAMVSPAERAAAVAHRSAGIAKSYE